MLWRQKQTVSTASAVPAADLEQRTQQIGRELLAASRAGAKAALWSEALIASALKNERFKTELFRFVDVFPVLATPEQIHAHLVEYVQQPGVVPPTMISMAIKAGGLLKGTLAKTVGSQIQNMARTFIAGETLSDALPALEKRWKEGIGFSVDLLGEAVVSHPEAAAYRQKYLTLIDQLPGVVASWAANPLLDADHLGGIPRANISLKISALDGHVAPVDIEGSLDRLTESLAPLLQAAAHGNAFINFDMEQNSLKELTIRLFKRCCERFDFHAGLALQAYLRSAEADARDFAEWARAAGRIVTVRLIKGAYWDYETLHAEMMNWPLPVWGKKRETDACFERATDMLIAQTPRESGKGGVKLALGTHNVRSMAHAMAALEYAGLPHNAIEFQALRGMADDLKPVLAERGWRVREYMPLGEMIPGMAYLVRRLLENTSNQSWLRAGHAGGASDDQLLAAPVGKGDALRSDANAPTSAAAATGDFQNEPLRDFSQVAQHEPFRDALAHARVEVVPNASTPADAQTSIARALAAFPKWRAAGPETWMRAIQQAAAILRAKRDQLAAEIVLESHKNWAEADGDVCEAIDFCEFYAREAAELFRLQKHSHVAGELNQGILQPRGVAAIIAPWNFPLSIPTGMTVAALVTGNAAILKPAEQTPAIARRLCEALWQAGVPRDVLHFLPGPGETVGAALVSDPRICNIAFTGSAAVGMAILKAAHSRPAESSSLNTHHSLLPRVIAEMGGKNAMIIDESADLDEAVLALRQSAFGYAGQKCSAASRAIVLDSIHDAFVKRLIESTQALVLGDPRNPATDIGPVIDAEAAEKIRRYIEIGKQEATLAHPTQSSVLSTHNLIPPHIFTNVLPAHRIAREEIFGPVLAILRAKNFDHALELANDSPYKLTGGIFSRTPSHLVRARAEFLVGNLYINRTITGALVSRQPFGGTALSGTGPKAGGKRYLLPFTDEQSITENTLRRGFAPTEGE